MKKNNRLILIVPIEQITTLTTILAEDFHLSEQMPFPCQRIFFDSFDWRLYQKNFLCFYENKQIHLHDFTDSPVTEPLSLDAPPPRFWQELPESALQAKLADILQIRALLPQAEFSGTLSSLELRKQQEDKPVGQAHIMQAGPDGLFELQLNGYSQKQFRKITQKLRPAGQICSSFLHYELEIALTQAGRSITDTQPFTLPVLAAEMESRKAAKLIFRSLLTVMQRNVQGITDDIDSEFLHDFRVAVRRTRSLLALLKNTLEPEILNRFRVDFRKLGRITGPVRDLDVQLLTQEECHAQLPSSLHEGLDTFFTVLCERRAKEQEKLKKELTSPEFQQLLQDWQEYLQEQSEETGKTIDQTAEKIIKKQFAKMLRAIQALNKQSTDEDIHQVRIQGKKLRYALEFFRSLYPAQKIEQRIKALKQLQDTLGLWNDLSVQEETLEEELKQIETTMEGGIAVAAAIGALLGDSDRKRLLAREELEVAFQHFTGKKNLRHWQQLFGVQGKKIS